MKLHLSRRQLVPLLVHVDMSLFLALVPVNLLIEFCV